MSVLAPIDASAGTLWTASSVVQLPAEKFSPALSAALFAPHTLAVVLLLVGLYLSFRKKGGLAIRSYLAGIVVGAIGFGAIMYAKNQLDPATSATFAYAYTGDRLTTVVSDDGGIRQETTTDGRIVECRGMRLADGRMLVLARFDNGAIREMTVDEADVASLVAMLAGGHMATKPTI